MLVLPCSDCDYALVISFGAKKYVTYSFLISQEPTVKRLWIFSETEFLKRHWIFKKTELLKTVVVSYFII